MFFRRFDAYLTVNTIKSMVQQTLLEYIILYSIAFQKSHLCSKTNSLEPNFKSLMFLRSCFASSDLFPLAFSNSILRYQIFYPLCLPSTMYLLFVYKSLILVGACYFLHSQYSHFPCLSIERQP
jgi:hypothetical protein